MKALYRILRRFTGIIAPVCLLTVLAVKSGAQSPLVQTTNPLARDHNGWRLYNATASFGYSTLALPTNSSALAFSLERLEGDFDGTASTSFGYNYAGPRGNFSLLYNPSYVRRVRYSQLSTFNHSLNLNGTVKLRPRWDLSVNVSATDSTLDQLLFTPAILSVATNPVASLGDLMQAANAGQYTSDQLASILTGTPYVATPARSIIYGTRFFSTSLNSNVSYRYSPRLTFSFTAGANRSQTRNEGQTDLQGRTNFLIPRTTSEQGGIAINYSMSLRTDIGMEARSSLIDSTLGRYILTNPSAYVSRKLTPNWFARVAGGPGFATILRSNPQFLGQAVGSGYTLQGNLGYTVRDHSLIASYNRMISDSYGFQSQSSQLFGGSWQWSRPGRSWTLYGSGGLQRMKGGFLGDISYWYGNAGFARSLSQQLSLNCTYGYVDRRTGEANLAGVGQQNLNGSSVRMTLVWNPQGQGELPAAQGGATRPTGTSPAR